MSGYGVREGGGGWGNGFEDAEGYVLFGREEGNRSKEEAIARSNEGVNRWRKGEWMGERERDRELRKGRKHSQTGSASRRGAQRARDVFGGNRRGKGCGRTFPPPFSTATTPSFPL
jgi:hypothetical protein